jgi:hypothetical protein
MIAVPKSSTYAIPEQPLVVTPQTDAKAFAPGYQLTRYMFSGRLRKTDSHASPGSSFRADP